MLKKKRRINDLAIVLILSGVFLTAGCFFYFGMTGFSVFDFLNDLFGKKAEVYGFEFANPSSSSIIDTISFVPSGKASGVGVDLFGATTRWGFDNALGFAFKVANEQKLKAVEFLVMQNVPGAGANALIYEGQGISGGGDLYYWTPRYTSNPIATLKLAQPYPDSSNTKDFQIFRFEADEPLTLKANTPYVVVFDPIATEDGQGTYTLPNIASSIGFLSSVGQPEQDIFMPSFLIRRQLDVRKSYTYNHWTFTRTDRRYLVRVIASSQTPSNPGEISFSSASYNVNENQGSVRLEVKRLRGSDGVASVNYAVMDGSAKAGQDYAAVSGTLSWGDKDSSIKYLEIPIVNDNLYEGNEYFRVILDDAKGASFGSWTNINVNIFDDETPQPQPPQPPQPQTYSLTITKSGSGSGTVTSSPSGINCGSDCSESYSSGTSVTLTATPDSSSQFAGWFGSCSGTGVCSLSMNSAKSVTAKFDLKVSPPSTKYLVDTISLNPTGVAPGTGVDLFGANTDSGYDYAFGSAFKVANEQKLKAVEFLVRQNVPGAGANALIYEGQGISGGGDLYYWTPRYTSNPIATLKLAQPYPDSSNTKDFQIFRFEADEPLTLKANTPYVVVFDPIPTAEGQGTYTLPNIASSIGFLSSVGQPEQNIFMPSFLVRRLSDIKKSYTYNQWTFTRTDRRYLVRVIAS